MPWELGISHSIRSRYAFDALFVEHERAFRRIFQFDARTIVREYPFALTLLCPKSATCRMRPPAQSGRKATGAGFAFFSSRRCDGA